MNLVDQFRVWISDAERLELLYQTLLSRNERAVRPEWRDRFFEARLMPAWKRNLGLWRSANKDVLLVGNQQGAVTHKTFNADGLAVLLRSALLLYMAAVDKLLHEALSKHFSRLAREGSLDTLVKIDFSRVYAIAQDARIRKGKGGKTKRRPGHDLKAEMLISIFTSSYLSTRRLEEICAVRGKRKVFKAFAEKNTSWTAEESRNRWSRLYQRRNAIAHECDVVRKAKARKVHFTPIDAKVIHNDLRFVKAFGEFLANDLK